MAQFFGARIYHIYLVYGLGFFVLGLAVALELGRTSESRFARAMRPLAAFGLLHGVHEWIEMFALVGRIAYGFAPPLWWEWSRVALLALSFAALLTFGVQMLHTPPSRPAAGLWGGLGMLTLATAGVLALGVYLKGDVLDWPRAADAWIRYSLGVPGALLAAAGMWTEWRSLRRSELTSYANYFAWAAVALALYGVTGQIVAPQSALFPSTVINTEAFLHWFGFPVQLLRALYAALIAFFVIRGMRAYEVDRQHKLAVAQREAREAIERRDALRGELLWRTVAAQEEERARLARELHDDTLQVLAGLAAGLKGTEQMLVTDPERAQAQLAQLTAMSSQAIDELRRLILDLRPSVLDDIGLVAAVRWYAESLRRRTTAEITVHSVGPNCRLPAPVETILFRIAQEGLNNAVRHSHASHVAVRLHCHQATTELDIQDDGVGFDTSAALGHNDARSGWGLVGIQERLKLAGGEFDVESGPGRGTSLHVAVPAPGPGFGQDAQVQESDQDGNHG